MDKFGGGSADIPNMPVLCFLALLAIAVVTLAIVIDGRRKNAAGPNAPFVDAAPQADRAVASTATSDALHASERTA